MDIFWRNSIRDHLLVPRGSPAIQWSRVTWSRPRTNGRPLGNNFGHLSIAFPTFSPGFAVWSLAWLRVASRGAVARGFQWFCYQRMVVARVARGSLRTLQQTRIFSPKFNISWRFQILFSRMSLNFRAKLLFWVLKIVLFVILARKLLFIYSWKWLPFCFW